MTHVYRERIDRKRAEYLFSLSNKEIIAKFGSKKAKKDWETSVIPQLHKTIKLHSRNDFDPVQINYKDSRTNQSLNVENGRRYAAEPYALMYMPKNLRNFIIGDLYKDYDISNCHPSLLAYLAETCNLTVPYINNYVNERSKFLSENQTTKEEMLVLMHTDKHNRSGLRKKSTGIKTLLEEVDNVQGYIWKIYSEEIPSEKYASSKNPSSSLMTIVLDRFETIVSSAFIKSAGTEEVIWMFDGAMIPSNLNDINLSPLLETDRVLSKWVSIVEKPIPQVCSVPPEFEGYDISAGKLRYDQVNAHMIIKELSGMIYLSQDGLYIYSEEDGLWSLEEDEHYRTLTRHPVISTDLKDNGGETETAFYNLMRGAYKLLRSIAPRVDEFDLDPSIGYLLFDNGVLCLKTGQMTAKNPDFHFTRKINRSYNANVDRSALENQIVVRLFQNPIPDTEKVDYLLYLLSRGIAGQYSDRVSVAIIGDTACGKGKLRDLMLTAFGTFVGEFMTDYLLYKQGFEKESEDRNKWLLKVADRRIIFGSEMKKKPTCYGPPPMIDGESYKRLVSGGDKIDARDLYKSTRQVRLQALMVMLSNDSTEFFPADDAVQSRHRIIGMTRKSKKQGFTCDRYFPADPTIDSWVKDLAVGDAMVSLMCKCYARENVTVPDIVQKDTSEYLGSEEEPLQWVLDNFEVLEPARRKSTINLWRAGSDFDFKKVAGWCIPLNELFTEFDLANNGVMSKIKFGKELSKLGLPSAIKKINKKTVTVRIGIRRAYAQQGDDSD